jgi:hypothetical protein
VLRLTIAIAFFLGAFFNTATAQAPVADQKFHIAVDTAGITEAAPDVYMTWVYSLSSPTSFPSSAILVAFDCRDRKVARMAEVKYGWNADSSGVVGKVVEKPMLQWVDVSIPRLFDLVCAIGPTHPSGVSEPTPPPTWDGTTIS